MVDISNNLGKKVKKMMMWQEVIGSKLKKKFLMKVMVVSQNLSTY
jgi:hypothetical protein